MKLSIDLANDTELRGFVKAMLIAEIKSISREEISKIIGDAIVTKCSDEKITLLLKTELTDVVRKRFARGMFKEIVLERIEELVNNKIGTYLLKMFSKVNEEVKK